MKFCTVAWIDSAIANEQTSIIPEPAEIISCGIFVKETNKSFVITRDDMGDGDYRGLMAIPKECIKRVDYLATNNHALTAKGEEEK